MEKKRPSRYIVDLAWTGRGMSLPARCKSEIIVNITSATKQMTRPNCSITSQYLTYLQRKNGAPGTWKSCYKSFIPRCNSQITAIINCATKLMSCPNSSNYSSIFDLVTEEKRPSRYLGDVALTGRGKSFQTRCKSEINFCYH